MSVFGKIFKGIFKFLCLIFAGRTGQILPNLKPIAQEMVGSLMDGELSDKNKFRAAYHKILGAAIEQGIETADHAIGLAIEWEITEAKDDPLEKVLDEGLGVAREVVSSIDSSDFVGDDARHWAAFDELRKKLITEGKTWLTSTHTLNFLIQAAVASFRK